jgi:hypothetical protein
MGCRVACPGSAILPLPNCETLSGRRQLASPGPVARCIDLFAPKRSLQAGSTPAEMLRLRTPRRPRSQLRAARFVEGERYGISYQVASAPYDD